jgi:NAD(P)H-hydrate epimerase
MEYTVSRDQLSTLGLTLPRRARTAHKGDFGRVFILAGCEGYTGAPVLAANAAVRSGAGLVFLGVPRDIYPIVAVKCDAAMPFPLPEEWEPLLQKAQGCDVALIGPGLGRSPEAEQRALALLSQLECPVVLDADGINALSGHIDILDKRSAPTVLTPHEGEFQRLTGCSLPIRDRLAAARNFALAHNCVLVLKGHRTVTAAPEGDCYVNTTGNPGMAKGGSGDVLAGLTAGLLAQKQLAGLGAARTAALAVYLHGRAGDLCAQTLGEYAMTPGDLLRALPQAMLESECEIPNQIMEV